MGTDMRLLLASLIFLLAGCASVDSYAPYVREIKDQAALDRDKSLCLTYARDYRTPLSPKAIAGAGTQGTLSNLGTAAISPLATALAGAGRASSEFISEIGLNDADQVRIYNRCLCIKGEQSGNYLALSC